MCGQDPVEDQLCTVGLLPETLDLVSPTSIVSRIRPFIKSTFVVRTLQSFLKAPAVAVVELNVCGIVRLSLCIVALRGPGECCCSIRVTTPAPVPCRVLQSVLWASSFVAGNIYAVRFMLVRKGKSPRPGPCARKTLLLFEIDEVASADHTLAKPPLQSRYEGNDPHAPVILQTFRPPKSMRQIFPVTQDEGSIPTPVDGTSPIHQPVKYAELLHTSPPTRPYRSFFAMPTGFSFSLTLLFLRN